MVALRHQGWNSLSILRVCWAIFSCFAVESAVFGFAVLPAILFWQWHFHWNLPVSPWIHTILLSMAFIPAYLMFSVALMALSALATRLMGWRTPADARMPIADAGWPLLDWMRYMISIQMVRVFAGPVFRATPLWAWYMRLNGAKLGRRVFVNSLWVTDHNLLDFGDDVVIGSEVHLSGHTVESGMVKTAKVRLGRGVTVGASAIVGIGVDAGDACQIGALSFVPKFSKLEAGKTYAGIPVHPVEHHERAPLP